MAAALGAVFLAAPARAADPGLIAAAQKEGEVTWYTTQIVNQFGRPAMDAFQRRYGIRVNFVRADSVELAARLLSEVQAKRLQADVFDGTASAPALKRAGGLNECGKKMRATGTPDRPARAPAPGL